MLAEGRVGVTVASDGVLGALTFNRTGAARTQAAHGAYQEGTARGKRFTISNGAAGVAPGTALGTTPPLSLYNPTGSGVRLVVDKVALGYVSGTLGAGSIVLAAVAPQAAAPTTGTALTPVCTSIGSGVKSVASGHQGSTHAATPTIVRPLWTLGASLATTPYEPSSTEIDLAGNYEVVPGAALVIQGVAGAGTTPLVILSVTYEEVPLVAS